MYAKNRLQFAGRYYYLYVGIRQIGLMRFVLKRCWWLFYGRGSTASPHPLIQSSRNIEKSFIINVSSTASASMSWRGTTRTRSSFRPSSAQTQRPSTRPAISRNVADIFIYIIKLFYKPDNTELTTFLCWCILRTIKKK